MTRLCENPPCGELVEAPERFCSRVCVLAVQGSPLTTDGRRRGALRSAEVRRAKALAKFSVMTPREIYTMGYKQGYQKAISRKPQTPRMTDAQARVYRDERRREIAERKEATT